MILERFYKGEPIQQSELPEDETVEADVLSISVPRNMFTDDKLENLTCKAVSDKAAAGWEKI